MSVTKIIAVVGATGATAGGLARAIMSDPDSGYACRAITREPESAAARTLADHGATVLRADLDDYDSLVRAFDGAYGAFCMTNFFEHFSAEQEAEQAANQARAAPLPGCATPSGRQPRTPARGTRSTTTACRRCRVATRCRIGTPKVRGTGPSLPPASPPPICWHRSIGRRSSSGSASLNRVPTACSRSPCRWATHGCPASRPKTSAAARTRSFRTRSGSSARRSASPASTRPVTSSGTCPNSSGSAPTRLRSSDFAPPTESSTEHCVSFFTQEVAIAGAKYVPPFHGQQQLPSSYARAQGGSLGKSATG